MIAHRTNGNWEDVTSIGRNEIVFEGRNKEYGAYVVRQRYNGALLLSLLIAASIGALSAGIPFVLNLLNRTNTPVKSSTEVVLKMKNYYVPPIKRKTIHVPVIPQHKHIVTETRRNTPPVVTQHPPIENIPTVHTLAQSNVGSTNSTGKPDVAGPLVPINTGTGGVIAEPKPEKPFTVVEHMPTFNGNLEQYIGTHISLPQLEVNQGIQGTLYVSFIVETDGSLSDIKILRGISGGEGYNNAAIQTLESMPKWSPGEQNGHPVRVLVNLPIHINLQ